MNHYDEVDERRGATLATLLREHARIAIVGGPRTGKTMLALLAISDGRTIVHTDDYMKVIWAEVPRSIIAKCAPLGRFVIEGVMVARALRAGLEVDAVLYLDEPRAEQSPGHRAMSKAVSTVFGEWRSKHRTVHVVSPDIGRSLTE